MPFRENLEQRQISRRFVGEKNQSTKLKNVNSAQKLVFAFVEVISLPLVKAFIDITLVGKSGILRGNVYLKTGHSGGVGGWQKSDQIPTFHLSPSFKAAAQCNNAIVTIFVCAGEKSADQCEGILRGC